MFVGMTIMGANMSIDRLRSSLLKAYEHNERTTDDRGSAMSSVELMVHPGYPARSDSGGCGVGPDDFAMSRDRRHEIDVLTSDSVKSMYADLQVCLHAAFM